MLQQQQPKVNLFIVTVFHKQDAQHILTNPLDAMLLRFFLFYTWNWVPEQGAKKTRVLGYQMVEKKF